VLPAAPPAASEASSAEAPPAASRLVLRYAAVKIGPNAESAVGKLGDANDTMASGDRFALYVQANQEVHLYVMQFFADKTRAILHEQLLPANQRTRVPNGGDVFALDQNVGIENLYLVASVAPLSAASSELAALVSDVKTSPNFKDEPPKPAGPSDAPVRGLQVTDTPAPATNAPVVAPAGHSNRAIPMPDGRAQQPAPATQKQSGFTRANADSLIAKFKPRGVIKIAASAGMYEVEAMPEGLVVEHFSFRHQ